MEVEEIAGNKVYRNSTHYINEATKAEEEVAQKKKKKRDGEEMKSEGVKAAAGDSGFTIGEDLFLQLNVPPPSHFNVFTGHRVVTSETHVICYTSEVENELCYKLVH